MPVKVLVADDVAAFRSVHVGQVLSTRRASTLTYVAVCCRMLPYAAVWKFDEALEECSFDAAVCYRMLSYC